MGINVEQIILESAEELFLERGYALVSVADIAHKAQCNTAMIHYYYRTKERLFMQVFESKMLRFIKSFTEMPLSSLNFEHKMRAIISTHYDFIVQNPKLPFLLINEITTNTNRLNHFKDKAQAALNDGLTILQRLIDIEVEAGRIRPIAPFDLVLNIISMNVMTFLAIPIITQLEIVDQNRFIENRKHEIIDTILSSIRPTK